MSDIRRRLLQLVATMLAFPVVFVAMCYGIGWYQDWRYVHPFERVKRGDSQERVVALLGSPHRVIVERNDHVLWETQEKIDSDAVSVKEFRYVPFSIAGEEYSIGFDASGRAVSKFHITSP